MNDSTDHGLVIAIAVGAALLVACLGLVVVALVIGSVVPEATGLQPPATPTPAATPTPVVTTRSGPPDPARYVWTPVAEDFDNPLDVVHADDGSGRVFILQQTGQIYILQPDGSVNFEPFLDISELLPPEVFQGGYTERGLLALAFHPQYRQNGIFFVSYTNLEGDSILARYRVSATDPDRADPTSAVQVLMVKQPYNDHNGGDVVFGPDGYLYMGFGDGGNVNVPNARSQYTDLLLGKLLRLNVDAETYTVPEDNPFVNTEGVRPEIWALGLRNPWRFSFDRATGDLYIADVGQWTWEEIDFQPAGSTGGQNYGWSAFEGNHVYLTDVELKVGTPTMPVIEYNHVEGCSITGGFVYRGQALPELQGYYFFGDYCNGIVWTAHRDPAGAWSYQTLMDTEYVITSFGEDEAGELYMTDYKGTVYRLERAGG